MNRPSVAVLTPQGRGAVATIGIRGAGAVQLVDQCVALAAGQPLGSCAAGRVLLGRVGFAGAAAEEVVVGLVAPDEVEVHCHGGLAAAEAVAQTLVAAGGRRVGWQEWVQDGASDPIAAAALLALPQARTERTAAILLAQYRGALRSEVVAIDELLGRGENSAAGNRLTQLAERADVGLHLTQPWRVVVAGRPNAGKSSLVNALLGYQRAIVFEQPGTTRDVLTAATALDGWPIELADTAGLRAPGNPIEAAGVERAAAAITAADLTLLVAETTAAWDAALHAQVAASARRLLIVHNKSDLAPPPADGRPSGIAVSAKTLAGIDTLAAAITSAIVPQPQAADAAVPITAEQFTVLAEAREQLTRSGAGAARSALTRLLGKLQCPP